MTKKMFATFVAVAVFFALAVTANAQILAPGVALNAAGGTPKTADPGAAKPAKPAKPAKSESKSSRAAGPVSVYTGYNFTGGQKAPLVGLEVGSGSLVSGGVSGSWATLPTTHSHEGKMFIGGAKLTDPETEIVGQDLTTSGKRSEILFHFQFNLAKKSWKVRPYAGTYAGILKEKTTKQLSAAIVKPGYENNGMVLANIGTIKPTTLYPEVTTHPIGPEIGVKTYVGWGTMLSAGFRKPMTGGGDQSIQKFVHFGYNFGKK